MIGILKAKSSLPWSADECDARCECRHLKGKGKMDQLCEIISKITPRTTKNHYHAFHSAKSNAENEKQHPLMRYRIDPFSDENDST